MEPWDSSSPFSHPTQSPSLPPKITYSAKGKEHRTLTHPLCYEVRCETVYFMMRRKLLHRMKEVCGATSRMMKDELIVGEHQVDGTRLLIYIYIYLYIDV